MLIDLTGLIINKLEKNYVNVNSIDRERERERDQFFVKLFAKYLLKCGLLEQPLSPNFVFKQ